MTGLPDLTNSQVNAALVAVVRSMIAHNEFPSSERMTRLRSVLVKLEARAVSTRTEGSAPFASVAASYGAFA
jgi:hypothetical protein